MVKNFATDDMPSRAEQESLVAELIEERFGARENSGTVEPSLVGAVRRLADTCNDLLVVALKQQRQIEILNEENAATVGMMEIILKGMSGFSADLPMGMGSVTLPIFPEPSEIARAVIERRAAKG